MDTKPTLTCPICGAQFQRPRNEVLRHQRVGKLPMTCSRRCRGALDKGKRLPEERVAKMRGRTPWNKGKPWSPRMREQLSQLASGGSRAREKNGHWKGGRSVSKEGYVTIRVNGKPKWEHVHVMEQHLGRRMNRGEVVHHLNEQRGDNRIENLTVLTIGEHLRWHNTGDRNHQRRAKLARDAASCASTRP